MTVKQFKESCLKDVDRLYDVVHGEVYDPRTEDVYDTCSEEAQMVTSDMCDTIDELLDLIPEWTPAWEKLPEKGKMVLAYYDNGYEQRITLAVHYENGWYDYTHYCLTQDIRYWMELPPKPEEDYA